ncbi:MAG: hypothetical protein IKJ62_02290 [Alphaproteobacteria bacterium]|nr:hypothetical protein [Alphaproteobacteria bacterium]
MAIGTVKQNGNMIYVYDERGHLKFTQSGELVGYTGGTVSIRRGGSTIYVYDDSGHLSFTR